MLCYVLFGGTRSPGPSLTTMCSNARGGGGGGSIKTTLYDPCFRSIHHVQGFPADLQLLSVLYIHSHTAGRQRIVASHLSRASIDVFYVHYRPILYLCTLVQCAIQAALKAASHHSQSSVLFLCSLSQHHVIISELSAISIQTAMFATLNLPTSAYPLLQLD